MAFKLRVQALPTTEVPVSREVGRTLTSRIPTFHEVSLLLRLAHAICFNYV